MPAVLSEDTMTEESQTETPQEPAYELQPKRHPGERDLHHITYDGREYWFRKFKGKPQLVIYRARGEDVPRIDALDVSDLAEPVLERLRSEGFDV
jgi:hypothetical protein